MVNQPQGLWVVGFHAVLSAVQGDQPVELVWVQRGRRDARTHKVVAAARERNLILELVPRAKLDRVAEGCPHNGCAVRTAPVGFVDLDTVIRPEGEQGRLVLLDTVIDPHNVGAVIRTAAAFALDGIILAGPTAPPLGGALAKAAAGQLGKVPMVRTKVAGDLLRRLVERGYWVLGADAAGTAADQVRPVDRWVLCLGAEQRGLRAKTQRQVDELIAVPIANDVDSLNLSVAAAVLLYELAYRWGGAGRPPARS